MGLDLRAGALTSCHAAPRVRTGPRPHRRYGLLARYRTQRQRLPSDPHRPNRRGHRHLGVPSPPARARRGPDPRRQGHRPVEVPVQSVRAQRGVARDRRARARPDRLDPSTRPDRGARQSRAQAAAIPPAARRRARVLRPAREAPPAEHLALGHRAQGRVPTAQSAPSRNRLTPAPPGPHHQAALRPRPRSPLPANRQDRRPRSRGTRPNATTTPNNTTITTTARRSGAPEYLSHPY